MSIPAFTVKTAEELKGMSVEELAEYQNQRRDHEKAQLEEAIEAKASKEDIGKLETKFKEALDDSLRTINKAIKEQGKAISQIRVNPAPKPTTFKEAAFDALMKNQDAFKALKERTRGQIAFDIKVPADMTFAASVTGTVPQAERIPGVGMIAQRMVRIPQLMNRMTTDRNLIEWVYEADQEGQATTLNEAAQKPLIDSTFTVANQKVEKIAARLRASEEMVNDIPWFSSFIDTRVRTSVERTIESQVYDGNGTSPNLLGIRSVASAFSAGASALSIDNANIVSVVGAARTQIIEANQVMPTALLMNPRDVYELGEIKVTASDRRYVDNPYLQNVGNQWFIHGIPVIESNLVTADQYLLGAFNLADYVVREGIRVEVGLSGDDFAYNMFTVRGEARVACVVQHNDRTAFVAGTWSTDITALETT